MYEPRDFAHLIGMEGFSETLLKNHFTLYQGYVANTNKLADTLKALAAEGKFGPEYAEMRRRFGWEWNGMRLHEAYFNNLGGRDETPGPAITAALDRDFGGFEAWKKEFVAIGAMRGIGWVVLCKDTCHDRLFNVWVNEHDVGHLAGTKPLVVMDVFEHAFLTDYGLKRADYLAAFMKNLKWSKVDERIVR